LSFQDVRLSFNYQLNDEADIFFDSSILAPGLNWIPSTVRLEKDNTGEGWTASFFSSLMDVVDSYPVSLSGSNVLQPGIAGNIVTLPDWDLFFHVDWESTAWVTSVEESVFAHLPAIDSQGVVVSSARSHNDNSDLWGQIMDLGKGFGVLDLVLDVLDSNVLGIGKFAALQILKNIFDTGALGGDSPWPFGISGSTQFIFPATGSTIRQAMESPR
jgi:hypothetical protein